MNNNNLGEKKKICFKFHHEQLHISVNSETALYIRLLHTC